MKIDKKVSAEEFAMGWLWHHTITQNDRILKTFMALLIGDRSLIQKQYTFIGDSFLIGKRLVNK